MERYLASGREGGLAVSYFVPRYLARIIPVCSVKSESEGTRQFVKGHSPSLALSSKSCRSRRFLVFKKIFVNFRSLSMFPGNFLPRRTSRIKIA